MVGAFPPNIKPVEYYELIDARADLKRQASKIKAQEERIRELEAELRTKNLIQRG